MSATGHYCSPTPRSSIYVMHAKGEYSHIPFSATANFCTTALTGSVQEPGKTPSRAGDGVPQVLYMRCQTPEASRHCG